jgi:Mitochondrial carrier protein
LFQQLKKFRDRVAHNRPATNVENSFMGCVASGTTVCVMMPLDTIKTRLVTQISSKAATSIPYKGIVDCAFRMAREEGIKSFYQGIAPRLVSVVPMIGIQFGVYEFMKNVMLNRDSPKMRLLTKPNTATTTTRGKQLPSSPKSMSLSQRKAAGMEGSAQQALEIAAMETAASPEQPYPVPHFLKKLGNTNQSGPSKKK